MNGTPINDGDNTKHHPGAPAVQMVPIGQLRPNPKNPRTISPSQLKSLCRSLAHDPEFMRMRPLIATPDGTVVAGIQRLHAAQELGSTEVPTIFAEMDDLLIKERTIRDNSSWGEWIESDLAELLDELASRGMDVGALGFAKDELDRLLTLGSAAKHDDETDFDPTPPLVPESRRGDLYCLGEHRVVCGSSTDADIWEALFAANDASGPESTGHGSVPPTLADAIWSDPPYGVALQVRPGHEFTGDATPAQATALLEAVLRQADPYLRPGAPWYLTGPSGVAGIGFLKAIETCGWDLAQTLVWVKNTFVMGRADYHHQHELIYYGSKPGAPRPWFGGRDKSTLIDDRPDYGHLKREELVALLRQRDNDQHTDVISIDKTLHNDLHPTMKPPALIRTMLGNSTVREDVVIDPFAGSGSTMIACEQLGRRAYMIELEPKFCDVIVRRWRELHPGNTVTRIRGGTSAVVE